MRDARAGDLGAIFAIYNDEVLHGTATFDTEPRVAGRDDGWLTARDGERHPVVVAVTGDRVVGWASLGPWSERGAYARTAVGLRPRRPSRPRRRAAAADGRHRPGSRRRPRRRPRSDRGRQRAERPALREPRVRPHRDAAAVRREVRADPGRRAAGPAPGRRLTEIEHARHNAMTDPGEIARFRDRCSDLMGALLDELATTPGTARTFPQVEDALGWPPRRIASVLGGVSHLRHAEFGGRRPYRFTGERDSESGRWEIWMDAGQAAAVRAADAD